MNHIIISKVIIQTIFGSIETSSYYMNFSYTHHVHLIIYLYFSKIILDSVLLYYCQQNNN
jgi:hypothetical protein